MKLVRPSVGVIGSKGDLGSQVVSWIQEAGIEPACSDISVDGLSVHDVLAQCDIVHFCIPASGFNQKFSLRKGQVIVLHDSVMSTSSRINKRYFSSQAAIVHMLMNSSRTVVTTAGIGSQLDKHLRAIGCMQVPMTISEHDRMMARSQTPLALLLKITLDDLRKWHNRKLLTPSGEVLLESLEARAISWTDQTMSSLLSNPEIHGLLKDMQLLIKDQRGYNRRNE